MRANRCIKLYAVVRLFIGLVGCCSKPVYAVLVNNLYDVSIPVADQTIETRQEVMLTALKQVLVKVSGDINIAASYPQLQPDSVSQLVIRYDYQDPDQFPEAQKLQEGAASQRQLHIYFAPQSVNQLLKSVERPIWGQERPLIMPLIAVYYQKRLTLLQQDESLAKLLTQSAKQMGIPLRIPDKQPAFSAMRQAQTIWSEELVWAIDRAKQHHAAYALLGRLKLQNTDSSCRNDWLLIPTTQQATDMIIRWQTPCLVASQAIASITQKLAHQLAKLDAIAFNEQQQDIVLTVKQVYTLKDYQKISQYLKSLNVVQQLRLESLTASQASFYLSVLGNIATLRNILNHGQCLVRHDYDATVGVVHPDENNLVYDYQQAP